MREDLRVSVILEGDNEKHCPEAEDGPVCLGLEGLREQNYPLCHVDLLLVGSQEQTTRWMRETAAMPFGRVRTVAAGEADYFEMKRLGASESTCPILAFVDSDVRPAPRWLATLLETLESGQSVAAGLTLCEWHGKCGPDSALMLAFGSISWGAILGRGGVLGFHANNVGFRAELMDIAWYREGTLRACAAQELFKAWTGAGAKAAFRKEQQVVHAFSFAWWAGMHRRSGLESLLMRRMFAAWPHQWVTRTGPLEPLLTALWRVACDLGQWWRYGEAAGVSRTRRVFLLPLLLLVSLAIRGTEMYGGYKSLLDGSMRREVAVHLQAKG